jgi:S1-C subfamily serine protease
MFRALFLALFLACSTAFAQDGIETGNDIWNWSPEKEYHKAIVRIETDLGFGCGTVIKTEPKDDKYDIAYIVSAAHVFMGTFDTEPKTLGKLLYYNGVKIKDCSVVQIDKRCDIVLVYGLCPKGLKPVTIAKKDAKPKDKLEFCGLGGKSDVLKNGVRHFFGEAAETTSADRIIANTYVIHGDSGGAVLNQAGELVGVISGGLALCSEEITHSSGWKKVIVFPALSCNAENITKLLDKKFNPIKPASE